MEEPIKMPEQCCCNCKWFIKLDDPDDLFDGGCQNEAQIYSLVVREDYCFLHELIPLVKPTKKDK